jgi:hypothetical protein
VQAVTELVAEGGFPTLQLQDVHCEDMPKRSAWDMLQVPTLNAHLAEPVPARELWLQEQEARHGMHLQEAMEHLVPVPIALGPVTHGTCRTIAFHLVNTGR